jgi:hypothetical protein
MTRRELIILLGGAVAWPVAGQAQQAAKLPTSATLAMASRILSRSLVER